MVITPVPVPVLRPVFIPVRTCPSIESMFYFFMSSGACRDFLGNSVRECGSLVAHLLAAEPSPAGGNTELGGHRSFAQLQDGGAITCHVQIVSTDTAPQVQSELFGGSGEARRGLASWRTDDPAPLDILGVELHASSQRRNSVQAHLPRVEEVDDLVDAIGPDCCFRHWSRNMKGGAKIPKVN